MNESPADATSCADGCSCRAPQAIWSALAPANERNLRRWAWALTAPTLGWKTLEAVIAISERRDGRLDRAGGFRLDSVVEVSRRSSLPGGCCSRRPITTQTNAPTDARLA
jgi:hypothetical protein